MGCHQIGTLQSLTLCALFPLEAPLFQKNFGARADPLPGKKLIQPFLFTWRAPRRVTTMKAISYALATAWLWHSVRISSEATRIHTRKCNYTRNSPDYTTDNYTRNPKPCKEGRVCQSIND